MEEITLRPELEALPQRMRTLPVDERGYPVPWFVDWVDGKPEFRVADGRKRVRAIREKLCWVCGEKLGRYMTFVAGPMCGINRTSSEPPSHLECGTWSARNCPFLNLTEKKRREDELLNNAALVNSAPGCPIARQPGVAMLWTTKHYSLFEDGRGGVLIHMGEPESVYWYCKGREATRAEVMESIRTGLPKLEELAIQQEGAMEELQKASKQFIQYCPAA